MAAIHRPALNKASALVHAAALIPLTVAFTPLGTGLSSYALLLDAGILSVGITFLAGKFYQRPGKATARRLFLGSLLYLPLFLISLVVHQQDRANGKEVIVNKDTDW
jgi:protoheme IX farnesyltransferase